MQPSWLARFQKRRLGKVGMFKSAIGLFPELVVLITSRSGAHTLESIKKRISFPDFVTPGVVGPDPLEVTLHLSSSELVFVRQRRFGEVNLVTFLRNCLI